MAAFLTTLLVYYGLGVAPGVLRLDALSRRVCLALHSCFRWQFLTAGRNQSRAIAKSAFHYRGALKCSTARRPSIGH